MKTRNWVIAAEAVVILCCAAAVSAQAHAKHIQSSLERFPVPLAYFGLHVGQPEKSWPPMKFGAWRLFDIGVVWADLEPKRGQWNFTRLDQLIKLSEEHDVPVLLNIGLPPSWASARPTEAPAFRPGSAAEPRDMADWRDYVQTLATRYKGRIHYWELWNEPNIQGFYTGSVAQMVALAKAAHEVLESVDHSNVLVSPPGTGYNGTDWLDSFLNAGGGEYVGVIGYHFYSTPQGPEAQIDISDKLRKVMARHGMLQKPLWDTEVGWYIQNRALAVKPESHPPFNVVLEPDEAAAFVARAYLLQWIGGANKCFWYTWDSPIFGLAETDGTPKPGGVAVRTMEDWLVGARVTACDENGPLWQCYLTRDQGYKGYIVWNTQGASNFSIPAAWSIQTAHQLDGSSRNIKGSNKVAIGIGPILLENQSH